MSNTLINRLLNEICLLKQEIITDELTGLYNRRYINRRLPSDLLANLWLRQPLSVIFADLDYFKRVNDIYGHTAGDRVLKEFAAILTRNVRQDKDWVARYGGEEFLIVLNGVGHKKLSEIAERMRIAVMAKNFHYRGQIIKLTCSFGAHTFDDFSKQIDLDGIIDIVDRKLYKAKSLGRNIVVG